MHHAVGGRHVGGAELDAAVEQVCDERHIAGEPDQLRDDQHRFRPARQSNRFRQPWPVVVAARFDFGEFGDQFTAGNVGMDGGLLGFQSETAAALLDRGYAVLRDEAGHSALHDL